MLGAIDPFNKELTFVSATERSVDVKSGEPKENDRLLQDPLLIPKYLVSKNDPYGYKTDEERDAVWAKLKGASLSIREMVQIINSVVYSHVNAEKRIQFDWSFLVCLITIGHNQILQFFTPQQKELLRSRFIPNMRELGLENLNKINDFVTLCMYQSFSISASITQHILEFVHNAELPKNKLPPITIIVTSQWHPLRLKSQVAMSIGGLYHALHIGFPFQSLVWGVKQLAKTGYDKVDDRERKFYDPSMLLQLFYENYPNMNFRDHFDSRELFILRVAYRNIEALNASTKPLSVTTLKWLVERGSTVHSQRRIQELMFLSDPSHRALRSRYSRYDGEEDSDDSGGCLLYTSPSPRDRTRSRMPSSA